MENKKFKMRGCFVVKCIAFIMMIVGFGIALAGTLGVYAANELQMYTKTYEEAMVKVLEYPTREIVDDLMEYMQGGYEDEIHIYLEKKNVQVALLRTSDRLSAYSDVFIWKSYRNDKATGRNGFYSNVFGDFDVYQFGKQEDVNKFLPDAEQKKFNENYLLRVFYDMDFPQDDNLRNWWYYGRELYQCRYGIFGAIAGGLICALICFIYLLCAVGHRNKSEGIVPGLTTRIYFDVFTFAMILLESVISIYLEMLYYSFGRVTAYIIFLLLSFILGMIWLFDFVVRLKMGKWWKHTLCYVVLRFFWRSIKKCMRLAVKVVVSIPSMPRLATGYVLLSVFELFLMLMMMGRGAGVALFLWVVYKILITIGLLYLLFICQELEKTGKALAEGKDNCTVDTSRMFGRFKKHGENLNSIGQGISRAVEARMKSERLKTELITNVSHDIKTPLTSIINYADLLTGLGNRETKEDTILIPRTTFEEYSEVLQRQSRRLKKLLEDLVEASKANTGNLEVNKTPCEVGVLLTQAVGEYQAKMEEKGLEVKESQPQEPVIILADGRHLWRVFDNLLGNIYKYAQENSRVYLSVEPYEGHVKIVFKNMSKYALNISADELEERFVRGDKSRHMEGNGLGLSIAKSLTQLQGGKMEIVVDGDLFKVILTFEIMET